MKNKWYGFYNNRDDFDELDESAEEVYYVENRRAGAIPDKFSWRENELVIDNLPIRKN